MIEFEERSIPDDQKKLVDLLRTEAKRVVVEDYNPAADRSSLDWVGRLVAQHPELTPRIQSAYGTLLGEAHPRVVNEVLFQIEQAPDAAAGVLVRALESSHEALQRQLDTVEASGRTLLGALVAMLDRKRPLLTTEAIDILAAIQRREDGWPASFGLALAADPPRFLPRLNAALAELDADELARFASAMVVQGEPLTTDGFREIAKGPSRDAFAVAVKTFLQESEESRQRLLSSGALDKFPPAIREKVQRERSSRWPEFAERLGVRQ